MKDVSIIEVDLAKNVFQLHGTASEGSVLFCKTLTRLQFERFMTGHPACTVEMEAYGGAHNWARVLHDMGHVPLLIAPRYVKTFVKRHKSDSADAAPCCSAPVPSSSGRGRRP
jgi:transposase